MMEPTPPATASPPVSGKVSGNIAGDVAGTGADDPVLVERRLRRGLGRMLEEHRLIDEGDRLLVAVSGGKDSNTLLRLLLELAPRAPVRFSLVAFHLDQGHPGHDPAPLARWFESLGVEHRMHREDTYTTVQRQLEKRSTSPCAPCSRFRRGILTTWAGRLGCNKIALGHHRDDALETLLLNLFHAGTLQAMPARYRNAAGLEVIRPLIACAERDLAASARQHGLPILPCGLCGSLPDSRRHQVKRLLAELEVEHPQLRSVMFRALGNVRPRHLLDRELLDGRPEDDGAGR